MAPGGYYSDTIVYTGTSSTTEDTWTPVIYYSYSAPIYEEFPKPKHFHPWQSEPKRIRFDKGRAAKVSPVIFDRLPLLNAYKSARSMAS
jgi:hypothetical protein